MATTVHTLHQMAERGEKIAMLACYDAAFATLLEGAGVDALLVGDSLGMVIQGHSSTLPVSMEDMLYHTRCVARGSKGALVITDMPFGSYQGGVSSAFKNAALLMAAGAQMVKLEGGGPIVEIVRFLVDRGIPVCGHLGLTPQSVNAFGGYRIQGKSPDQAEQLLRDAKALEQAGADLVVLEAIPTNLARRITAELRKTRTIGIGAGADCHGQVLVLYDILDIYPGKKARFVKNFMTGAPSIEAAVSAFVTAVKSQHFPAAEHGF